MKIESASIAMQSTHVAFERTEVRERFDAWGMSAPPSSVAPQPNHAIEATRALGEATDAAENDPRLVLLRTMIEVMTGQTIRILRMADFEPAATAPYPDPTLQSAAAAPASPQGPGMSYSLRASHTEYEQVAFSAAGVVRTADGQEIRFDLAFMMERTYRETFSLDVTVGEPRRLKDPLVLDFAGSGASLSDARFAFDLDADGTLDRIPLPVGGRGFLAIDRNGNGRIDDGSELFGPTTGNGFRELAALDADGNGWIDESDPAIAQLRLWQPDENGGGTLETLDKAGVGALSVASLATPFSLRDADNRMLGLMRASGVYIGSDGSAGTVSQIDLAV